MMVDVEARADLLSILRAVREEQGPETARRAARTLRDAALEGRVDGSTYGDPGEGEPFCGCALGQIGQVTGFSAGTPDVPGWDHYYWRREACDFSPLERHVLNVAPGTTPATSQALADLVDWLDNYLGN